MLHLLTNVSPSSSRDIVLVIPICIRELLCITLGPIKHEWHWTPVSWTLILQILFTDFCQLLSTWWQYITSGELVGSPQSTLPQFEQNLSPLLRLTTRWHGRKTLSENIDLAPVTVKCLGVFLAHFVETVWQAWAEVWYMPLGRGVSCPLCQRGTDRWCANLALPVQLTHRGINNPPCPQRRHRAGHEGAAE